MRSNLTQARLKELLNYDPETGIFTWRVDAKRGKVKAGSVAGHSAACGYRTIRLDRRLYRGARLAHLYVLGFWPEHVMDHLNGTKSDDRWENLRPCTQRQNTENIPDKKYLGASLHKPSGLWRARHAETWLGYYSSPEGAHQAYLQHRSQILSFNPVPRGRHTNENQLHNP